MRIFTVYMHVNKLNNKKYVGITCQPPKKRWRRGKCYSGSPHFYRAIQKYGWDNFDHLILASGLSETEAKQMEIDLIEKYKLRNPKFGYNLAAGGQGRLKYTTEQERVERLLEERAWQEQYNKEHKEYFKIKNQEYYKADPEKYKQQARQYYIENTEKVKAYSKVYKLEHKEQNKLRSKETGELRKVLRAQLLSLATKFPERFSEEELLKLSKRDTCRSITFLTTLLKKVNY
jgi:group I intron endonuclease